MKGTLAEGVLPGLLRDIYVGRKTGFLRFTRGEERCDIGFVNGHLVSGASSFRERHLGEVMVALGLLAAEDLVRATEVVIREGRRLGQVLLGLGLLDDDGLESALARHAREVLLEIFSWNEGSYLFETQALEAFHGHDTPLRLSTGEVIFDAVWSVQDQAVVGYALGDIDRALLTSTDPLLRFQRITLTPTDGFILSQVDGTLSAREILMIVPGSQQEAERSLLGLLCTGMVEYASPCPKPVELPGREGLRQEILDTYGALASRDHHQVLGVLPGASTAEIQTAYSRLVKRYHPDAHHDPALRDLGSMLGAIFQRLNEAYRALSRAALSPTPAEAPPPTEALDAENLYLKAKKRLDEGKHWEAVALLGEMIPLAQGALRRRARVLLAKAYGRSKDHVKEAEKELRAVLEEDPRHVPACLLLGDLYQAAGLTARAGALYSTVLELQPEHAEARAALKAMAPDAPGLGGAFRKLFHGPTRRPGS